MSQPLSADELQADIAELKALALKCEQETQVFLGHRNAERAESIRRVLATIDALTPPEPPTVHVCPVCGECSAIYPRVSL